MADPKPDFQAQLRALQEAFAKELPKRLGALEAAWLAPGEAAARLEALRHNAHSLAGSGGTFGFPELGQAARALERRVQALLQAHTPLDPELEAEISREVASLRASAGPKPADLGLAGAPSPDEGGVVRLLSMDPRLREELVPQLQAFGFQVDVHSSYRAFLASLGQGPTALALLDLESPGPDPVALADLIPFSQRSPLPLVIISDQGDLPSRLEAVRAGAKAFLSKGLDIFELLDRLDVVNPALQQDPVQVLIIEDDPVLAENHALVLRSYGVESTIVTDPLKALRPLADRPPDLILMDLNMPGCTGLELAAVIRQQDVFVGVPIVFLSGELREEQHMAAMRLGADDFLTKPANPQHLASVVLSRAQRGRRLRSFMVRDSLTGLLNHSAIKEQLAREFARAERLGDPLCLAMIDLDHFKKVNDTHGHPGGDRVIRTLARLLQQRLRKTDLIGRYGGEEFAVILPHTTPQGAFQVLEDLRKSFGALRFPFPQEPTHITLSCGIAGFPGHTGAAAITEAADQALYQAKRQGRNRVVLAGEG